MLSSTRPEPTIVRTNLSPPAEAGDYPSRPRLLRGQPDRKDSPERDARAVHLPVHHPVQRAPHAVVQAVPAGCLHVHLEYPSSGGSTSVALTADLSDSLCTTSLPESREHAWPALQAKHARISRRESDLSVSRPLRAPRLQQVWARPDADRLSGPGRSGSRRSARLPRRSPALR